MNIKFSKMLQTIRTESNLSQQQIANIINCSRGTYSCWEHDDGEIPFTKLLMLLDYCKISLPAFLKRIQEENNNKTIELETEEGNILDIRAELAFIGNRIALINENLNIKSPI